MTHALEHTFFNLKDIEMKHPLNIIKGRGAQINTANRFHNEVRSENPNNFEDPDFEIKTQYIETNPKTIINKVDSPDIGIPYSMNPYQGCEHGCVYCYARNTHPYWGYSAGLDFETKILVKKNAAELLKKKLTSKNWKAEPIMLAGNTDCYQPAERKFKLTRKMLEVLRKYGHPVGIITKNDLLLRDLDILKDLQKHDLISVAFSISTLDEKIRAKLEPRTSSIKNRLKAVEKLSNTGIHVSVLAGPVIPGLTDDGILPLAEACANAGANSIHHIMVRLNGDISKIFSDWARKAFPDRAEKMLNQISATHKGKLNDSEYGHRMRGSGAYADIVAEQFRIARQKYFPEMKSFTLNTSRYGELKNPKQYGLFD